MKKIYKPLMIALLLMLGTAHPFPAAAGLFCGELRCDLSVPKHSRRVTKTEKVTAMNSTTQYAQSEQMAAAQVQQHYERYPEFIFGRIEDGSGEYRNCSAEIRWAMLGDFRPLATWDDKYLVSYQITCDKVTFDALNPAETRAAICQRATECAHNVRNVENLKDYLELRDRLCGKENNLIAHSAAEPRSSNAQLKTITKDISGEDPPSNAASEAAGHALR